MRRKSRNGLIVFIITLVVVALVVTLSFTTGNKIQAKNDSNTGNPNGVSNYDYDDEPATNKKNYLAAIQLEGTIESANTTYNQKWLLSVISELKYDQNNVGIALYIDSPGGAVYQADEVYLALKDYKKTGKKIYVYMGPLAASGGYYISCAADKIYANRNTLTGSIGVIASHVFDFSELLYNIGIESTTIYSGDNKNMGAFDEEFTEEQQEIMQEICDECYEQFLSIVVQERKMTEEFARKLADGRVYTAAQALKNGLIDVISDWDSMIKDLSYEVSGSPLCKVKTYKYEKKLTFMEQMMYTVSNLKPVTAEKPRSMPLYMYQR